MGLDCWAFDGNQTGCTGASANYGVECSWSSECVGPPEKGCWGYTSNGTCSAVAGCNWGMCYKKSCWDYTTESTCEDSGSVGFSGKQCQWKTYSWGGECQEQACWSYTNKTDCQADNCTWNGACMETWCGDYSGTNASACVNNSVGLSCSWDAAGSWCNDKGCWNYPNQNNCNAQSGCIWDTYEGGWCEEQGCWNWEGQETNCTDVDATLHPGLACAYDDPWCFENVTAKGCGDIGSERDCMDTFYCWWNYTGSTCNDPSGEGQLTEFIEWNPGCFIFDMDQSICVNTTGCYWNTSSSLCKYNDTEMLTNELNCSLINNQTVCNSIPAFSTCCKWQGSSCAKDQFDQSCHNQMEEPPAGAYYCEDYNAYTNNETCLKIAGSPWYMPCKWNNVTERCEFKGDDIFASGETNIMKVDNKQNCIAAGGNWLLETYPSTNDPDTAIKKSLGRCDYKFDDERNCDKECYACDYKTDKTNWASLYGAKEACIESALGICGFTSDSTAPNGFGYCKPKTEFKKGLTGGTCDNDCGACTFMGDPAASAGKKPSDYCGSSKAKCKWVADPAHKDDDSYGICVSGSEKTCEQKCDKCYDESTCRQYGGKNGNESADLAAVCEWSNGMCVYKSGASKMEICWDGTDNNGDNKIDCADSMCFSDPFCGGGMMFSSFGVDCFIFTDNSSCVDGGCAWVNENWGSWCDMPGAVCWKNDGTNESYCEEGGTCEWHSGFGGMCEQDWDMGGGMNACMNMDNTTCENQTGIDANCTWVVDDWCQNVGGTCEQSSGSTVWKMCDNLYGGMSSGGADPTACDADASCFWKPDPWCALQSTNAGFCDHKSFACNKYKTNTSCVNTTNNNNDFCSWKQGGAWCECTWPVDSSHPIGCTAFCSDYSNNQTACGGHSSNGCEWRSDSWCEGKMMSGGEGSCWSQNVTTCDTTSGCSWTNGLCDPPGFGGEMMMGMSGGSGVSGESSMSMGGFGMQCMIHDGNQTACQEQTGCGWFNEPWPFCDINFASNCPQYSYNQTVCENETITGGRCKWNSVNSFCDEKAFECFWNTTLQTNLTACDEHQLCFNNSERCDPLGFNATTQNQCEDDDSVGNASYFRWMAGWCNPAMASQFFGGMEMGSTPIHLGTDPVGDGGENETDITSFGVKDMGFAFGYAVTVNDVSNSAACNGIFIASAGSGGVTNKGQNTTKFYWYLDTDGDSTNNCNLRHNSSQSGFEFYFTNSWTYDSSSGSVTESPAAYRCSGGNWTKSEIKVSSVRQIMCSQVTGAMIAIEKADLEKFPSLYTSGTDIRVSVVSANNTGNASYPVDWLSAGSAGWISPGTQDFDIVDLYGYETDSVKKAGKEGLDAGFIQYGQDANCWTAAGCGEYICKGSPYCVENGLGVESSSWADTRIPKVVGMVKEVYPDGMFIAYFTDKPANGTLSFYGADNTCKASSLNDTVNDPGIGNDDIKTYKLWHLGEIYNDGGVESLDYDLANDTAYYYKIKVCDDAGKCGESKCSNFTTESNTDCSFCKFVSKIKAPTGWNVYYDLDADGDYEHWQGHVLGLDDGMFTNYTSGRRANILMNTSDGTAYLEFINVTLTKTGMNPKIRDVSTAGDMKNGTTTDSSGNDVGYVGMIDDTRDKIVNNLYPRICRIKIPSDGTCNALWHCDDDGENCVDRSGNATSIENGTAASNGTNYCIWQIPYCEFSVWASGEPGTVSSPTPTSSSSGGGGGAGGGSITAYAVKLWLALYPETPVSWEINKTNIAVTQINISVNNQARTVKLTVSNLSTKPGDVSMPWGDVYQYLNITPQNIENINLKSVKIKFNVEKSWLSSNNIDGNTVALNRYTNGVWNRLATNKFSEDINSIAYQAEVPGFSYFAITGEEKEQVRPAAEAATTTTPSGVTTTLPPAAGLAREGSNKIIIGLVVLSLIALALVISGLRKNKAIPRSNRLEKRI